MASAQSGADTASVLATGITGELTESGLASPTYALSFVPVQRLMLQASSAPIMRSHADSMLAGTPVALPDLVRLGLLRQDGQQYRINYLVLTAEDQRTIHRVAQAFGADLARAIDARRSDFRRHLARYPNTDLRDAIEFDLVAGMLLNWEGLALSTRLGYRAAPVHHANGDEYLVHSSERAPISTSAGFTGGARAGRLARSRSPRSATRCRSHARADCRTRTMHRSRSSSHSAGCRTCTVPSATSC